MFLEEAVLLVLYLLVATAMKYAVRAFAQQKCRVILFQ
jgi:hypothetical protein